ncbi:MAG: RNA methyltransferase [Prevotella sp.]|nr:RNA methyltransferase [Prevotella sp.]
MISKNLMKYVRALETKKGRKKEGAFVAEGPKVTADLMNVATPIKLIATDDWFGEMHLPPHESRVVVSEEELKKISFLQHPQRVMGVFPLPDDHVEDADFKNKLYMALDGVQDPGNLGTIIRIADWFGIESIFCSHETADAFNPKVVQATMGSIARVKIIYTELNDLMGNLPKGTPVYGTFLDGKNIYDEMLDGHGIIVMGNEGKGISDELSTRINRRLLIPNYPENRPTADSLNVAVATAITCAEFRRRA